MRITYILGGLALLCGVGFGVVYSVGGTKKINKIGSTNYAEKAINKPQIHQIDDVEIKHVEKLTSEKHLEGLTNLEACFTECQRSLVDSALSGVVLSSDEMTYIYSNLDDFVHFLRFHPETVEKVGIYIATADVGDEGQSDYDENLDKNVTLLNEIISELPISDLKRTTDSLLSSGDKTSRQAGLVYVEKMFQNVEDKLEEFRPGEIAAPDVAARENKVELSTLLNNFLYTETDPKIQIKAIQMLADYNPDMVSEQIVGLLSAISTNALDTEVRGQAIELAAVSAQPDSLVLTQIENELRQPSSVKLQGSSLRALDISLRRSFNKDKAMMKRLGEFEVYLDRLAKNTEGDTEISNYAAGLLEAYYAD